MRRLPLLATLIATIALLTGCATSAPEVPTGPDPLSQVQVSGELGEAPDVTIGDVSAATVESVRSVVIEGDGPVIEADTLINTRMAVYDGATKLPEVEYQSFGQVFAAGDTTLPAYFRDIFLGASSGSRVLVIIPGSVLLEQSGQAAPGATPGAPAVIVADLFAITADQAWGAPQQPSQELVTVTDGADGRPEITVQPGAEAPAELVLDVRKQGDGVTVADGDSVYLQYRGVLFSTGEEFDSTWDAKPTIFATDQVVDGFAQALVGQSVGSQVIAIIPPSLAYGDVDRGPIPGGSTLVFVVDILAVM